MVSGRRDDRAIGKQHGQFGDGEESGRRHARTVDDQAHDLARGHLEAGVGGVRGRGRSGVKASSAEATRECCQYDLVDRAGRSVVHDDDLVLLGIHATLIVGRE
jgi:hypothetical protein